MIEDHKFKDFEEAILSGEEVEGTLEYFLVHTISFGIMELV